MWAIDTTDDFVFCFCFHSLSVSSANCHLSLSRGRGYECGICDALYKADEQYSPLRTAEKAKEKGHPKMSFEFNFSSSRFCLCRPTSFHCCLQERSCALPDIRRG